ncbi:MAG: WYL domain-containing protein [Myxococcales bacterium]|nr:WYL domain-containing protein [Myxococcales bacterium]
MNRLERLLDLVHVLQTSRRPVSLAELKDRFDDYAEGSDEAVRRKFERDKAELARIGIVLRYDGDEDDPGYWVDTEATYLPALQMSDAEHGLLATAARAALADPGFPHRAALRLALAKLGARADGEAAAVQIGLGVSDAPAGAAIVESLSGALASRKRVTMRYQKAGGDAPTEREVDPYGVFLKRGAWYLVGHDHRSDEVRMFRVSRMSDVAQNPKRPGTPDYEVPTDFDLEAIMQDSPLSYRVHPPVEVAVRVDPEVAFLVERDWGAPDDDGVVRFETTFLDFVLDQVLALGPRAELLSPEEGRRALRDVFASIVRAHGGAA